MTAVIGLGRLIRFTLRRDRFRLMIWVTTFVTLMAISAWTERDLYPDQATIDGYAALFIDNPALMVFAGPGYGFDRPTIGLILVNETQLWGAIVLALMAIFMVARGTRAEEDTERIELLRSTVVGRHAPMAATLVVTSATVLVIGVLTAISMSALGYGVTGSIALAGSMTVVGLVFVGVTAVAAQIASSNRATLGFASGALVVAFVLRAVGDVGGNVLTWLSPIGWAQAVRAFAGERWWTLAVTLASALVLVALAAVLADIRDLGSGMVPSRPGRPTATGLLRHPIGWAFSLQRGPLAAWAVVLFVTGLVFGSIADDIAQMLVDNPQMADFFAQLEGVSVTDSYLATAMTMLALTACGFAVSATLVVRTEEVNGRTELLLTGRRSRTRWSVASLVVAAVGTTAVIGAAGLGTGVGYAVVDDDPGRIVEVLVMAMVTVPAALVMIGLTIALHGISARLGLVSWGLLAATAIIVFFAELLRLPRWVRNLSPFEHVPVMPVEASVSLVALMAIATSAAAIGVIGLGRRDIGTY